jgi:uncharacterized protein (TIGR00369 family)
MDETSARAAFEQAITSYSPGFGSFFLARLLALDISYTDEECIIRIPVRDFLFNPQGCLHGGIIATVMDISMGHLLRKAYGAGGATLEMKIQYLRPVRSGIAVCTGRFTKRGRNIVFLESRLDDQSGKVVAISTSTWNFSGRQE